MNHDHNKVMYLLFIIISVKVFRTHHVFTPRRWTFHEHVHTAEHRAHDNVRVLHDRPKNFYSNNKMMLSMTKSHNFVSTLPFFFHFVGEVCSISPEP